MTPDQALAFLVEHQRETALFSSMGALLHWDARTQIPAKGHPHRAEQLAALAKLVHARQTDPRVGEALDAAGTGAGLADPDAAPDLREWRRAYSRAVKVPPDLAVALARCAAESETAWEAARPARDWKGFLPHLERMLALRREEAAAIGFATEAYDALLDDYEPYELAARIAPVFAELRAGLARLLDRIRGSARHPDPALLRRELPLEAQEAFCREVATAIGLDFASGRLDRSAHPFSTRIGPGDARITTRFAPDHLAEALFGTVHETGHALYELGLPAAKFGRPSGAAASLSAHESQSRLWENQVARSRGFWEHFLPRAQAHFPALADADLDAFHFAVNQVRPGLIRVDADEVTYNLHVMLRFELELALVRGDLAPADLPGAWDEKMGEYLGLTPPHVAAGAMQDVHWAAGLFGYFPTYTLGNLVAAQLFAAACREQGDLEAGFAQGRFAPLLDWLRAKVHSQGSRLAPRDLVRQATGAEPDPAYLLAYLEAKYEALYRL